MHFHWGTKRAAGRLGKVVLGFRLASRRCHRRRLGNRRSLAIDGALHSCLFPAVPVELKLYSREWCSWCIDAKEYLTEKGYRFNIIDVGTDRQAYAEMKRLSEQTYVPTFVAGDRVLANFDTDQLEKFLNEHQINP